MTEKASSRELARSASLGPDKHDAQDTLLLYVWDPERSTDERGFALYAG